MTQLIMVGLVGVWPVDALVGIYSTTMTDAAVVVRAPPGVPGPLHDHGRQSHAHPGHGRRRTPTDRGPPTILDHPAIPTGPLRRQHRLGAVLGPAGRNAEAFQDVLAELAASFVNVQRMDLVFVDDYPNLRLPRRHLRPATPHRRLASPAERPARLSDFAYTAAPTSAPPPPRWPRSGPPHLTLDPAKGNPVMAHHHTTRPIWPTGCEPLTAPADTTGDHRPIHGIDGFAGGTNHNPGPVPRAPTPRPGCPPKRPPSATAPTREDSTTVSP